MNSKADRYFASPNPGGQVSGIQDAISIKQASVLTGKHKTTIQRAITSGRIRHEIRNSGEMRVSQQEVIDEWGTAEVAELEQRNEVKHKRIAELEDLVQRQRETIEVKNQIIAQQRETLLAAYDRLDVRSGVSTNSRKLDELMEQLDQIHDHQRQNLFQRLFGK